MEVEVASAHEMTVDARVEVVVAVVWALVAVRILARK